MRERYSKNLAEETIAALFNNGKTRKDIRYICEACRTIPTDVFFKVADREYVPGREHVSLDLTIVGNGWWLEREEYDGNEWWEFREAPKCQERTVTEDEAEKIIFSEW